MNAQKVINETAKQKAPNARLANLPAGKHGLKSAAYLQ
jgi:hypothetical protein